MKQFVLDTNILIESPDAIWGFDDSETHSEYALNWRKHCWEENEKKKTHNLSKLPIGTKIIWTRKDGVEVSVI